MEKFRNAVPPDVVQISFEFDESPTVVHAVESVATEGAVGAGLTGLMILLFLRDLRTRSSSSATSRSPCSGRCSGSG